MHPEIKELLQALLTLGLGLISITCFAIGWKIMKCPTHIYNKHRTKLLKKGFLTEQEWEESYRDILG